MDKKEIVNNKDTNLSFSIDDIIKYYKNDSIKELLKDAKIYNCNISTGMPFYGCFPIIENNKLIKIKICIPKVIDLKTALVNIHELKHGLDLLPQLNDTYQNLDYETSAQNEEKKFIKTYVRNKI